MSLAGLVVTVGLVLRVLLVDTVVGQVHELVAQSLHGRRIPAKIITVTNLPETILNGSVGTFTWSLGLIRCVSTDLQLAKRTSPSE